MMATPSFSKQYTGPPNLAPYPPPLARYEELVGNRKLFMNTLEQFHSSMNTKFMIPIIGGKDLDLHRLFVEVTARGGIEKVIRERKWKEVTSVFNFPSTATNASFVLRKYYGSLLHHYEQLYFFNAQGWSPFPAGQCLALQQTPSQVIVHPSSEPQAAASNQRKSSSDITREGATTPVIGVIDGKFEGGYLVTVTVGAEKLKGVLYETIMVPVSERKMRKRRKHEIKKRDPDHPKPNRSGYNFFFAEQHARLKPLHPGKDREISRMIGELWNNLKEDEKAVFQEKAVKDKERYRVEMEEYREKQRGVVSDAMPLQQWLPEQEIETTSSGSADGSEDDKSLGKEVPLDNVADEQPEPVTGTEASQSFGVNSEPAPGANWEAV